MRPANQNEPRAAELELTPCGQILPKLWELTTAPISTSHAPFKPFRRLPAEANHADNGFSNASAAATIWMTLARKRPKA
jgi:hypothetical protein